MPYYTIGASTIAWNDMSHDICIMIIMSLIEGKIISFKNNLGYMYQHG